VKGSILDRRSSMWKDPEVGTGLMNPRKISMAEAK